MYGKLGPKCYARIVNGGNFTFYPYQPQHLQVHSRPRMSNRRRPRRRGLRPHPPQSPLPRHRRPPRLQSRQLPQRPTKQEFQGVLRLKFHC